MCFDNSVMHKHLVDHIVFFCFCLRSAEKHTWFLHALTFATEALYRVTQSYILLMNESQHLLSMLTELDTS